MSIEFTRTYTKTYKIVQAVPFGKYGYIVETRKKWWPDGNMKGLKKCFVCGKVFIGDDHVNLATIKGHENRLICDQCAERVNSTAEGK